MRAIRVASAALLGVSALSSCAPAAMAKGDDNVTPFGFSVMPSTIAAGGQVSLRVERAGGGCRGAASVTSGVFDTVTIRPGQDRANAVVDRDARAGATYRVTFTCDGASGSTDLTIAGDRPAEQPQRPHERQPQQPHEREQPSQKSHEREQPSQQPHRPEQQPPPDHQPEQRHHEPAPETGVPQRGVHAGEGGTLGGLDLREMGLGLALVTGSVGAAYHLSRRRSGTDGA
ncbi:hypothetical protein [Streptomyces sp. NPDC006997]|uniref:hypothetical protein n=1 Tax=Streptomyces sp. NPDC006997 TaxID=3155356 RepID=UPI00340CD99B